MASFDRRYRQKIVDEFLAATGANSFAPVAFLEWLEPQTDHRAWKIFFGKDDVEAARQFRLGMVRQFVSGLRITVEMRDSDQSVTSVVVPAFISPVASRSSSEGGGYVSVSINEDATQREMARQAAAALESWLRRYDGFLKVVQVDAAAIRNIANELAARGVSLVDKEASAA